MKGPVSTRRRFRIRLTPKTLIKPSGRGLLLMKAFMDRVEFNATGNDVTMALSRVNARSEALPAEQEPALSAE